MICEEIWQYYYYIHTFASDQPAIVLAWPTNAPAAYLPSNQKHIVYLVFQQT